MRGSGCSQGRPRAYTRAGALAIVLGLGISVAALANSAAPTRTGLTPLIPIDRLQRASADAPGEQVGTRQKGAVGPSFFVDGFEARLPEQPVQGQLRFTSNPHISPRPIGTQLESASAKLATDTDYRFLQADTSTLVRLTPSQRQYVHFVDFDRMHYANGDDVVAPLFPVDLALNDPASSNSGCEMSDFDGFPAGHIALLQRGGCDFSLKALNAENAGAVAVIVFNQGTSDRVGRYFGTLRSASGSYSGPLPVISTTFALGAEWAADPGATFRLRLDSGMPSNAWELKPVAGRSANFQPEFWIRNAETGQLMFSGGPRDVDGETVTGIDLGSVEYDDPRARWRVGSIFEFPNGSANPTGRFRLFNVATNEPLATIVRGANNAILVTAPFNTLSTSICSEDPSCAEWRLDNFLVLDRALEATLTGYDKPQPFTRLRSALGDQYLQISGGLPIVDRIKPDWVRAQWVFEFSGSLGSYRIRNVLSGDYLYEENGRLEAGKTAPTSERGEWFPSPVTTLAESNVPDGDATVALATPVTSASGYLSITNRGTGQLLVVEGGQPALGTSQTDRLAALWIRDDLQISIPDVGLRQRIQSALGRNLNDGQPDDVFPIFEAEAAAITDIVSGMFSPSRVSSITGIERLPNLEFLDLSDNDITDISALENLTKLSFVNLSGNPVSDIGPLARNDNIADDDTVLLVPRGLESRQYDDADLAVLIPRGATIIPGAGQFVLRDERVRGQLVEVRAGIPQFVQASMATNAANWEATFATDGQTAGYWIRNLAAGYMTYNAANDRIEFTGDERPATAEWFFQPEGGFVRIINRLVLENGNLESFLKICPDPAQNTFVRSVRVNTGLGCSVGQWALATSYLLQAIDDATIIPSAGDFLLSDSRVPNQVLDVQAGVAQFQDRDGGLDSWETTFLFNGQNTGWWIKHSLAGYMTWSAARNRIEFSQSRPDDAEWRYFRVGQDRYEITHIFLPNNGNQENWLKICPGLGQAATVRTIGLNVSSGCTVAQWDLSDELINRSIDEARTAQWSMVYPPPSGGFTRIRNDRNGELLHMDNGPLEIGRPDRESEGALWKLTAQGLGRNFYFVIQNKLRPDQYIYRDATGAARAGPLPPSMAELNASDPDPNWVLDPINRPFLFDFASLSETVTIRPLVALDSGLRSVDGELAFAPGLNADSVWILDGRIQGPRPIEGVEDGFVILRTGVPPFEVAAEFEVSYRVPTDIPGQYDTVVVTDDQIPSSRTVLMPWNAYDIDIKATCDLCRAGFETLIDLRDLQRPPNACFETRGTPIGYPHYGGCDIAEGQLSVFAENAAAAATCELRAAINFLPELLAGIDYERVGQALAAGDTEGAGKALFASGNPIPSDLEACPRYGSMSFGGGLAVSGPSIGNERTFDLVNEIGVVWPLDPSSRLGASSYSSTSFPIGDASLSFRILSVELTSSIGFWKDTPRNTQGRSYGVSLGASGELPIDFEKLEDAKKVGVSAGLTLWFQCDTGVGGLILDDAACEVREDSRFEGFSIDFSLGTDASVGATFSPSVSATVSETCVPADLEGLQRTCD